MPREALLDKICARRRAMMGGFTSSFDRRFPNIPVRRYPGMLRGALPDKIFARRRAMVAGFTNSFDRRELRAAEGAVGCGVAISFDRRFPNTPVSR